MIFLIAAILGALSKGTGAAVRAIWSAITGLYALLSYLASAATAAERRAVAGFQALSVGVLQLASSQLAWARWLMVVRIPTLLATLRTEVIAVGRTELAMVRAEASAALSTLTRWTQVGFNVLDFGLATLRSFTLTELADLRQLLAQVLRTVALLAAGPDVLAQWLVAAMARALLRYLQDNTEPIVRWLLANAVKESGHLAALIEDMIVRVL